MPDVGSPSLGSLISQSLLPVFELAGRLVLLIAAVLYALGFVVENIHLARFGYFSLGLFERRYALAGFWALAPFLMFLLFQRLNAYSEAVRTDPSTRKWPSWLRFLLSMALFISLFYAFQLALAQLLGVPLSWWWWLPFIYGSGLLQLLMTRKAVARWRELTNPSPLAETRTAATSPTAAARMALAEVEWSWAPVAFSYLVVFVYILYPQIPASWGGGGAERIQLLLPVDESGTLATLGLHRVSAQLSAPTTLVATTADDYVLLIDSSHVAYVRRDLVRAVTLEGRFRAPVPLRRSHALRDSTP